MDAVSVINLDLPDQRLQKVFPHRRFVQSFEDPGEQTIDLVLIQLDVHNAKVCLALRGGPAVPMGTFRVDKVKLLVLPKVKSLTGVKFVTNRMHEVFKRDSFVPVGVEVIEHFVDLRFR